MLDHHRSFVLTIAAAVLGLAAPSALAAQAPTSLGTFSDWNAFAYEGDGGKVCFIISEPKKSKLSRRASRGDVFFMVTHWTGKKRFGEPSIIVGYPLKNGYQPRIRIGSDKFSMKSSKDAAWIEDEAEERRLINAMRKGVSMTVTGMSGRGTRSEDRFSLSGVSDALKKIDSACGR